jgi:hypothetical protein
MVRFEKTNDVSHVELPRDTEVCIVVVDTARHRNIPPTENLSSLQKNSSDSLAGDWHFWTPLNAAKLRKRSQSAQRSVLYVPPLLPVHPPFPARLCTSTLYMLSGRHTHILLCLNPSPGLAS